MTRGSALRLGNCLSLIPMKEDMCACVIRYGVLFFFPWLENSQFLVF